MENMFMGQGFLYKTGNFNTSWKRRYFQLRGTQLMYFENELDVKSGKASAMDMVALGTIEVLGAHVTVDNKSSDKKKFCFSVKPCAGDRTYHLAADSERERRDWMKLLYLRAGATPDNSIVDTLPTSSSSLTSSSNQSFVSSSSPVTSAPSSPIAKSKSNSEFKRNANTIANGPQTSSKDGASSGTSSSSHSGSSSVFKESNSLSTSSSSSISSSSFSSSFDQNAPINSSDSSSPSSSASSMSSTLAIDVPVAQSHVLRTNELFGQSAMYPALA
jgi:hypothetical protein